MSSKNSPQIGYGGIQIVKGNGIKAVASTTVRDVVMNGKDKVVKFNFVRFREY